MRKSLLIRRSRIKRRNPSRYFRSWKDIEDVFPHRGGLNIRLEDEKRGFAISEVYRRVPGKDFKKLYRKYDNNRFQWFIPYYDDLGSCQPFPSNYPEEPLHPGSQLNLKPRAEVIYLNPRLERLDVDIAIAVVAHEIAHVFLDHKTMGCREYDKQEKEAWDLVKKWGFQREFKKYSVFKNRIS